MNTIFIDFDGVMHPVTAIAGLSPYHPQLDLEIKRRNMFCWLPLLEEVLQDDDDITIAVHSSWKQYLSNDQMNAILGNLASRYIGITPIGAARYHGILQVVQRAGIEHHLILDDATDEFPLHHPDLVATHPSRGLNDERVMDQIKNWLKKITLAQ